MEGFFSSAPAARESSDDKNRVNVRNDFCNGTVATPQMSLAWIQAQNNINMSLTRRIPGFNASRSGIAALELKFNSIAIAVMKEAYLFFGKGRRAQK
jgi:hypothetical protein